jgi:hypothetical protein
VETLIHRAVRADSGARADALKLALEAVEFIIGEIFEVDEAVASAADGPEELVQFQVEGLGIAVLSVLNEEDHEERDDSGGGIDDKLPGVGEMEKGTENGPDDDGGEGEEEGCGSADRQRKPLGTGSES